MGMQLDFAGKRVLVTGSTKGIGRGAAEGFHELGARVAINGRSAETVAQAIEEMGGGERLIAAPGDLSSVAGVNKTVSAAIAELGGLDVLVNNAGRGDDRPIDGIDEDYWQMMIDLNLKGAFFTAQACVPALKESRGNIINIASMMGVMGGPEGLIVYCTTKGAMIQMTRMMALDLSRDGVRVNNLCPGWIDTPMIQNENEIAGNDALLNYINADCPLGRTDRPCGRNHGRHPLLRIAERGLYHRRNPGCRRRHFRRALTRPRACPSWHPGGGGAMIYDRPSSVLALGSMVAAERDRWILWLPVVLGIGVLVYFALPAALMACVVLALPCSTCPIVPLVTIDKYNLYHHTPGLNS